MNIRIFSQLLILWLLSGLATTSQAQSDSLVLVHGKVINAEDSAKLSVSLIYEKLPYYDDIGMISSSSNGNFQAYLLLNREYNFKASLNDFQDYEQKFTITDEDGDKKTSLVIRMEPVQPEELITLNDLTFGRASAVITESSYSSLDNFIEYVNERPKLIIQLEGHTDFAGDATKNLLLSEARVEAVAEYIIKNGVDKKRVVTKAFGGSQPLTRDRSEESKAKNRRVEVRLIRPGKS
jgi:outer membrane protein OmpA-like peptidoglycan-associated protein